MQIFFDELLKELRYEDIGYDIDFQTGATLQFTLTDDDIELAEAQVERIINSLAFEQDIEDLIQHVYISHGVVEIQTNATEYDEDTDLDDVL